MKRDLSLIRGLLLNLEALNMGMYGAESISPDDPRIAVEGYDEHQIAYHLELIQERRLIEVPSSQPMIGIVFTRLSWSGHELLDAIRDEDIWRKTKAATDEIGSLTFDLVRELAQGFIKKKLEDRTGVRL